MSDKTVLSLFFLIFFASAVQSGAKAAPGTYPGGVPRRDCAQNVYIHNMQLGDALALLARGCGYRFYTEASFDKRIRNMRLSGKIFDIIDRLTGAYNLSWFADRGMINVERAEEAQTKVVYLPGVAWPDIKALLDAAGLVNVDRAVRFVEGSGQLRIVGSSRLIGRIESIVASLRARPESVRKIDVVRYGHISREVGAGVSDDGAPAAPLAPGR